MTGVYWLEEPLPESPVTPGQGSPGRPDVEVVGGGVTGCACALALARSGAAVRLHEAREIAGGASGRNGGFALRGGAMPYDVARDRLGSERATSLWSLTERALDRLAALAGDAFQRVGSLRLAADEAERDELRREYEALSQAGFEAEWVGELPSPLAGLYLAAVRHPPDGSLQPARWVRRLAARAAAEGVEIRERSRVDSLELLEADQVVLATDGYTQGLLPELDDAVQPIRGQVIATAPLAQQLFACPHYARHGFDYWQQTPDGRLVLGGRRDVSLETELTRKEETTPEIQSALEQLAEQLIGAPPGITHRWSGIFGVTQDRLPLAGSVPGKPRLWIACGYSGHGNVLGFACGELVAAAIAGQPAPELELFDPARPLRTARPKGRLPDSPERVSDGRAG
jgi:gamma-glutamylputrescine oxidase